MSGLTRARRACRRSSGGPRIVPAVSIAIIGDHFMPPEVFREKIVAACGDRARTLGRRSSIWLLGWPLTILVSTSARYLTLPTDSLDALFVVQPQLNG